METLRGEWGEASNFVNFPDMTLLRESKHEAGDANRSKIHDIIFLLILFILHILSFILCFLKPRRNAPLASISSCPCPLGGAKIPGTAFQESWMTWTGEGDEQGGLCRSQRRSKSSNHVPCWNPSTTVLSRGCANTSGHLHSQKTDSQSGSCHLLLPPLEASWNQSDGAAPRVLTFSRSLLSSRINTILVLTFLILY